ncbi:hypothetical protein TPHA_0C03440 [Tetrapisispora phaffii CBS 4417]|uniref:Uncharacterized protein n=1 Tax=Tetrapisispora phaffii (strain ATCC 24235 / CBS 4417 / NBRC 1672 / NRRL Y-8282 / UCD 70-5) TaxID=1071381 RepID=G8BRX0_TETPH|nr:hypothetical protein TPHA_0C03440 [Tetrapisispora phaffii CBS 4417]CCE62496.1 hypothetical protein TPHA_0C03440 [Tetrapisispora phaffii CBS 4417]
MTSDNKLFSFQEGTKKKKRQRQKQKQREKLMQETVVVRQPSRRKYILQNLIPRGVINSGHAVLVAFYLLNIVVTIPISFKIGGIYCGLSFTGTLFGLYFISTSVTIITKRLTHNTTLRLLASSLFYIQNFIISSLLQIYLRGFNNKDLITALTFLDDYYYNEKNGTNTKYQILFIIKDYFVNIMNLILFREDNGLNKMLQLALKSEGNSVPDPQKLNSWILFFYYYYIFIKPWKFLLINSTPFFTLLEGFFTILGIQTIGETNIWLKQQKHSSFWVILSLLSSGGVITATLYYLNRIYVTPFWDLTVSTASMLGFTLSIVGGLGVFGIVSKNGSAIESSLFFAYIVRCIYEMSPELAISATDEFLEGFNEVWQMNQNRITVADNVLTYCKKYIMDAFSSFSSIEHHLFPKTIELGISKNLIVKQFWVFLKNFTINVPSSINDLIQITAQMAVDSISPAIIINLSFRLMIFYSATRIIPAIQRRTKPDAHDLTGFMSAVYWFSPCMLIAMYTHLILQFSGELKKNICLWNCENWLSSSSDVKSTNLGDNSIIVDSWSFWNWCNIFWTIIIYASELIGGRS